MYISSRLVAINANCRYYNVYILMVGKQNRLDNVQEDVMNTLILLSITFCMLIQKLALILQSYMKVAIVSHSQTV